MEWYEIIISILSGITVSVPLVIKLINYVKALAKEKNWGKLIVIVSNFMAEAETLYLDGASKKEYVIHSIMAIANTIDYPINAEMLGELIDSLTALSNKVNINKK